MVGNLDINRRDAALALVAVGLGSQAQAAGTNDAAVIYAYTDQDSYQPGDVVQLRVSAENFAAYPVRATWTLCDVMDNKTKASGQLLVAAAYPHVPVVDQQWPVAANIQIPSNLASGCYYLSFDLGKPNRYPVIVRENWVARSDMLVIIPTATWQAYNNFGGKSSYPFNSGGLKDTGPTSYSLNRPHAYNWFLEDDPAMGVINSSQTNWNDNEWYVRKTSYERRWLNVLYLSNWLRSNYSCSFATDVDLHSNKHLLTGRKCLVFVGHNEYWTNEMRDNLQSYLDQGGSVANLGGNTCWWSIKYADDNRSIIFDKATVNAQWSRKGNSAKKQFGSGFENGGASPYYKDLTAPNGWRWDNLNAKVFNSNHWIYDGADVVDGSLFGASLKIADYEVDGIPLLKDSSQNPYVMANTDTPANYEILATADLKSLLWDKPWNKEKASNWTVGFFKTPAGGLFFNAATVSWGLAFSSVERNKTPLNPAINMTRNFLRACLAGSILYEMRKPYLSGVSSGYSYTYQSSSDPLAGWSATKSALLLPRSNEPGAVPLYACRTYVPHPNYPAVKVWRETLSTTLPKPAPDLVVTTVGYAFTSPAPGRRPVYAFVVNRPEGNTLRFSTRYKKKAELNAEVDGGIRFYVY